jgi:hypothetical protein
MMQGSAANELTRQWGKLTLREDEHPGIVIKTQTFPLSNPTGTLMHGGKAIVREIY